MSGWTWTCPCGRKFYGNDVEEVERRRRKHYNRHRQEVLSLITGEPPEGWQPGFNC